jgi:hypothetical protein
MQPDQTATPQESTKVARSMTRDGLVVGMVLGFAVWLPFMLFSARFLAQAVNALFATVLIALLLGSAIALGVYLFRRQLASRLFGDVTLSMASLAQATSEAVGAWPDRGTTLSALQRAVREGAALASWFLARRTMVAVLFGMVGSVVAMVGTVLLLKQTQALEDQNRKLDAQTTLLERQTNILAAEGLWELLWRVHFAPEPAIRLDAAADLAAKGYALRGVVLEGPAVPDARLFRLLDTPAYDDGAYDRRIPMVLVPERIDEAINSNTFRSLPPSVASHIEMAELKNLNIDIPAHAKPRGTRFAQSRVTFSGDQQSTQFCAECSFSFSNVRVERAQVYLEDTYFRQSQLWSGVGTISLLRINFDTLVARVTWGRDTFRDCHGYGLVVDYLGWSGDMSRPTFDGCVIGHILFLWQSREMSDVPAFLERTISRTALIGEIYFVKAEGFGSSAKLTILRGPSAKADAWNQSRKEHTHNE